MTALKATFIPGDKTIFYDDFTDMGPDDAPPHLKVRGASPALMTGGNVRQLKVAQRSSFFPNLTGLPGNFTYETELMFNTAGRAISHLILMSKSSQSLVFTVEGSAGMVHTQLQKKSPYEALGRHRLPANLAEPVKAALWVQNGRVRAFINGEKVLDANQVTLPATTSVELANDLYGATAGFAYRNLRFAESTPDLGQVIMASGRYAVRGILFDTDSDRIKPESAPVIQSIARGLQANAGLKILIEGHTDASGNAQHNLDLSQRRAEALKAVLVAQFSIDAGRLATAGLGAAKPVESNDTPQGRAMNRRVELVRQ
jgi:outer membrane protein OmpA-like peptidoglycan-associated protein